MKADPTSAGRVTRGLTNRQKEVVKLISEDLTSKEIAQRLGITLKTAQFHRTVIKQRLGVHGSAGITRYAIREEIIKP